MYIHTSFVCSTLRVSIRIYILIGPIFNNKKANSRSSIDSSSTISTKAMENIVEQLKIDQYRDSTRLTYYNIWKLFNRFFVKLDHKPSKWEDRIVLFAGFLINENLKSQTVKSYLSTIRGVLTENGYRLSKDFFLLSSLTWACKLRNDSVLTRLPIHKDLLRLLMDELEHMFALKKNQPYMLCLYRAVFATAYHGLFKVGELTASPHSILVQNVHIGVNKNKLPILLESSKTHCKGDLPQIIKINSTPINKNANNHSDKYCPFIILKSYIKA